MKQKITPMAGCCMEASLWQMIRDLCRQMIDTHPLKVSEADIILEDDIFKTISETVTDEFTAIWYLGAMVAFMSSGHEVFGGRGIEYQKEHKNAKLPVLCKEHQNLTRVLHACITSEEKNRVTLSRLYEDACSGIEECRQQKRTKSPVVVTSNYTLLTDESQWPEEME